MGPASRILTGTRRVAPRALLACCGLLLGLGSACGTRLPWLAPDGDGAWMAGDAAAARDRALVDLAAAPGSPERIERAAWLTVLAGDLRGGLERLPAPPVAWRSPLADWIDTTPAGGRDSLLALADGAMGAGPDWSRAWIRSCARRGTEAPDSLFARLRDAREGWTLALAAGSSDACAVQLERLATKPPRGDFRRLLERHPRPGARVLDAWTARRGPLRIAELEALASSGAWAEIVDQLQRRPDDRERAVELEGMALAMLGRDAEALATLRTLSGEGGEERRLWLRWLEDRCGESASGGGRE